MHRKNYIGNVGKFTSQIKFRYILKAYETFYTISDFDPTDRKSTIPKIFAFMGIELQCSTFNLFSHTFLSIHHNFIHPNRKLLKKQHFLCI
jgi:hypothetical protein